MPVKELTELTITDLWKEFNLSFKDYWQEHNEVVKVFKKRLIEEALDAERSEWICCNPYERSSERQNQRNGYWRRWITLKDGRLEIKMPRIRNGGYESQIIPQYKQRVKEVDEALKRIFLYGASTRLTGEALRPII